MKKAFIKAQYGDNKISIAVKVNFTCINYIKYCAAKVTNTHLLDFWVKPLSVNDNVSEWLAVNNASGERVTVICKIMR